MKKIILLSLIALSTILPDSLDTKPQQMENNPPTTVSSPQQTAVNGIMEGHLD